MRHPIRTLAFHLALAAATALTVSGPASAAEPADDEVVIESGLSASSAQRWPYAEQVVSITRRVSYADLDLVMHADVETLQARVRDTAKSICAKLDGMYWLDSFEKSRCEKEAVRGAMRQVRGAIAAAEHKMRTASINTGR